MLLVIATVLNKNYTGQWSLYSQNFTTILVEAEADIITTMKHVGWKSHKVIQDDIDNTLSRKVAVSKRITDSL